MVMSGKKTSSIKEIITVVSGECQRQQQSVLEYEIIAVWRCAKKKQFDVFNIEHTSQPKWNYDKLYRGGWAEMMGGICVSVWVWV